ncbi:MAG TPA: hypothetical protein VGB17_17355 [Pyrinomonadaceae bacterium]|jgi:hypothetical protein
MPYKKIFSVLATLFLITLTVAILAVLGRNILAALLGAVFHTTGSDGIGAGSGGLSLVLTGGLLVAALAFVLIILFLAFRRLRLK